MISKFIFARLKILDEKKRYIMCGKVSQDYHISSSDKSTNDDQSKIYQKNHEIEKMQKNIISTENLEGNLLECSSAKSEALPEEAFEVSNISIILYFFVSCLKVLSLCLYK